MTAAEMSDCCLEQYRTDGVAQAQEGSSIVAQPRASWKGYLKIAELSCPVALYATVSSSSRISLHIVNRDTGHRLRRQFVDVMTGEPVDRPTSWSREPCRSLIPTACIGPTRA
jgi:DNA end-binding protein Ku